MIENDGLPTNICFRCMNRIEIYTEYRDTCIDNDKFLRDLITPLQLSPTSSSSCSSASRLIIKNELDGVIFNNTNDDEEDVVQKRHEIYMEDVQGETEFYPDENSLLMVVDPTKYYDSSDHSDIAASDTEIPFQSSQSLEKLTEDNEKILREVFLCQYCDLAFTKEEACVVHEVTGHNQQIPHTCNFCPFNSPNRNIVIVHIKDVHGLDKPFICVHCKKGFGRRSDLKKHTVVHTGVRPYMCPVCQRNFSRNTNLTKHMRIHSGHKPHVCNKCPRSFTTKSDLFRHFQIHLEAKPFKCVKCPASFTRKDKLHLHQKKHLKQEEESLKILPSLMSAGMAAMQEMLGGGGVNLVSSKDENDMTVNMVIPLDPFQDMDQIQGDEELLLGGGGVSGGCKNINNGTSSGNISGTMMDESSGGFSVPDHIQNLDLVFPDNVTGGGDLLTYQNLEDGAQHQHHHHHQQQQQQLHINHMSSNNDNNKMRTFPCDKCTKKFTSNASLQNHRNIHLGVRNHICKLCNKAFLRKRELDRHSVVHTGMKPFECQICRKRFSRKDKLVRHVRIHSDEKMFRCDQCPSAFNRKDGLLLHKRGHAKYLQNSMLQTIYETTTAPRSSSSGGGARNDDEEEETNDPIHEPSIVIEDDDLEVIEVKLENDADNYDSS